MKPSAPSVVSYAITYKYSVLAVAQLVLILSEPATDKTAANEIPNGKDILPMTCRSLPNTDCNIRFTTSFGLRMSFHDSRYGITFLMSLTLATGGKSQKLK